MINDSEKTEKCENAGDSLRELVFAGAGTRWGILTEDIRSRLDFELAIIADCGQTDYILMSARLAAAIEAAGGRIGPGRGACTASAVLYALGITNVDPMKHDLLFELFMMPERKNQRSVLIDTDLKGFEAAREFLIDTYGEIEKLPRRTYAPQLFKVNGWEIGLTHDPGVERLSCMVDIVREALEEYVDVEHLPQDDRVTLQAFRCGELVGIPRYDFPAIQKPLSSLPDITFDELVNVGALSCPGLWMQREAYLARRLGRTNAAVAHPLLNGILDETCGLLVYQEQVLLILRRLAGFTRGEADQCRRAVLKLQSEALSRFSVKFIAGCRNNPAFRIGECKDEHVANDIAKAIWNDIERNGRFAFMKAHAVAAARLAYELGSLQCHYRAEWCFLEGKDVRPEHKRRVARKMYLRHIASALEEGCQVTILMRHAERPPLEPGDTTFGEQLPITMRGVCQAREFGSFLSSRISSEGVRIFAGNTLRTIQTGAAIKTALEDESVTKSRDIELVPELGGDSPFFGKLDERMALISEGRYRDRLNEYFQMGAQRGYRPLAEATEAMECALERLEGRHKEVVVAVTHDINVAAFLAGRGVVTEFDEEMWPHYCDAAVIIRNDEGEVEYGYYRRDRTPDGIDL